MDIQRLFEIRIIFSGLLILSGILVISMVCDVAIAATMATPETNARHPTSQTSSVITVAQMCNRIGNKLGSISIQECLSHELSASGGLSVRQQPIVGKEYLPFVSRPRARILLFGGIHGDEYSSVSIVFKWMRILDNHRSGLFHWYIVPVLNPDGLLRKPSQRVNANEVDLNRNFPPVNGGKKAGLEYWVRHAKRNPRRYPGSRPLSEPESRWLVEKIDQFEPDVIIAIHAPYGVVDFDGRPSAPQRLGRLRLNPIGAYPGSLGNYAALQRDIPVVTIELRYAGILPDNEERQRIWFDLIEWLAKRFSDIRSNMAEIQDNSP
uniref:Succinylglutamate desuccinylase / Aspartoacylase family protein n=1 Tax=Candidatus Kentrum sp. LPFa TaxID=2126335 RepID=A0A450WCF3_9GAMM|nr:MAG: Succinylglutamate desuccinylase / Aspartoacylase family protein [Candidatus Kentron sp. LPFa]